MNQKQQLYICGFLVWNCQCVSAGPGAELKVRLRLVLLYELI